MTLFEMSVVVPKDRLSSHPHIDHHSHASPLHPSHSIPKTRMAESLYAMMASEIKRVKGESLVSANKIVNLVSRGFRPAIPDYVPRGLSTLITQCWDPISLQRPSFTTIREILATNVSQEVVYGLDQTPSYDQIFAMARKRSSLVAMIPPPGSRSPQDGRKFFRISDD